MKPTFKINDKDSPIHITDKHITNGHWLFDKEMLRGKLDVPPTVRNAFKKWINLPNGRYHFNDVSPVTLDVAHVVPRDIPSKGYSAINAKAIRAEFRPDFSISAFVFENEKGDKVGVNPDYVLLTKIGHCFMRSPNEPIIILEHPDLESNLIGLLMPVRI